MTTPQNLSQNPDGDSGGDGPCARLLDLAVQMAWGIHHAHQEGLIHQDVKAANVMVDVDDGWTAKVTDFGIARALDLGAPGASYGGLTPEYCSPEQAHAAVGARIGLTRATDVWSWALCVLEMFAGDRHWRHGQLAPELFAAFLEGRLPQACPMPPALAELLWRCFETDPAKRPQRLDEVAAAVADVYADVVGTPYPRRPPQGARLLADGLSNQALSLLDLDRADEAEQLWSRAMDIDPHHPSTVYNWAVYRWRHGVLSDEQVVAELETARRLEGERWQEDHLLGLVHVERGADDTARELLASAPDLPEVRSARAELARRVRQPEPARLTGHRAAVTAVAVDAEGEVAVTGDSEGRVLVWAPARQRLRYELTPTAAPVTGTAVSADGTTALVARGREPVEVWDLVRRDLPRVLTAPPSAVTALALNDSGTAVVACEDGRILVWDARTGRLLRDLTHPPTAYAKGNPFTGRMEPGVRYEPAAVHAAAVTADTGLVVTATSRGASVVVWDVGRGRPRHQLVRSRDGHLTGIDVVALSPDGTYALLANSLLHEMHIWETRNDRTHRTVPSEFDSHLMVAVSADARIAVSAPKEGVHRPLRVWETDSGRCLSTISTRQADPEKPEDLMHVRPRRMALSGDGRIAVLGEEYSGVQVYHLPQPGFRAGWSYARPRRATALDDAESRVRRLVERAEELAEQGRTAQAAAQVRVARAVPGYERHPDLRRMWSELGRRARARRTGLLGLWRRYDMRGGTFTFTQRVTLALSPDGELMVTGGIDGFVRVWNLQTGQALHRFPERAGKPHTVLLADEGRLAVSADWDGTAHVWDLASGSRRGELYGDCGLVKCVSVDRAGQRALVGTDDGALCLWDLGRGSRAPSLLRTMLGHDGWVQEVRLSDDGKYVASAGGEDRTGRLWRTATGAPLLHFPVDDTPVALRFAADGRRLFVNTGRDVSVWDVRTRRRVCARPTYYHETLALSADARIAATCGMGTVEVWETDTGRTLCELPVFSGMFDLSPDGRYVLSTNIEDDTPRLWDVRTGTCVHTLEPHPTDIMSVAFTADGRNAVTTDRRPAIRLWELDWDYDFTADDGTAEAR